MCSEGVADTYYLENVQVFTDDGCATTVVDVMTTTVTKDIIYYTKLIAGAVTTLVLEATTDNGKLIDHVYCNFTHPVVTAEVIDSYFPDYDFISLKVTV